MPGPNDTEDQLDYDAEQLQLDADNAGDGGEGESDPAVAEASSKGWVPKDQYKGDPAKWVDAATFVERGNNFNVTLKKKVTALEQQLAAFKGTADQFKKYHEQAMAGKQKELDAALSQLKREHREAIRDGDDDAADALEGRMETLRDEKAELAAETAPKAEDGPPPELAEWVEDGNQWFRDDKKMADYAVSLSQELLSKGETLRGRPFLDKVAAMMREEFPAKFGNPNRQRSGMAEGSQSSAAGAKPGRTERDLPAADRALMREFVAAGYTTKEKFLAEYRW